MSDNAEDLKKTWVAVYAVMVPEEKIENPEEDSGFEWDEVEVDLTPELIAALETLDKSTLDVREALEDGIKKGLFDKGILREHDDILKKFKGKNGAILAVQEGEYSDEVLAEKYDSPEELNIHFVVK